MTISDWLMIGAVVAAPFLAVFAQRKLDECKEKRGQKLWIFRTLMASRGTRLSIEHVQALNSIDLFYENRGREKKVIDKWHEYLDHLNTNMKEDDPDYRVKLDAWANKSDDILSDLLASMGQCVGYDFDKVRIKKGMYAPRGHADIEFENTIIRRGMVDIMLGRHGFPVSEHRREMQK